MRYSMGCFHNFFERAAHLLTLFARHIGRFQIDLIVQFSIALLVADYRSLLYLFIASRV